MSWVRTSALRWTVIVMAIFAQGVAQRAPARAGATQRTFGEDEPFSRPIPVPKAVMDRIGNEDRSKEVLDDEGLPNGRVPQDWLRATKVSLGPGRHDDILVRSPEKLAAADAAMYWVFERTLNGYRKVFSEPSNSLVFEKSIHHGRYDIDTAWSSANHSEFRSYRFNGREYRLYRRREEANQY